MLRWFLRVSLGVVVAVGAFAALVYWRSEVAMARVYTLPERTFAVTADAAQLERGRHLAVTRGCTDCHGADLGGRVLIEAFPLGRIAGPNITRGGVLPDYSDASLEHAIRHGVDREGKPLRFMPSEDYYSLADEDVAALIAYLRDAPAVEREVPESSVGPLARTLWFVGKMPLLHAEIVPHDLGAIASPVAEVTPAYGRYVAQSCTGCHGTGFSGGAVPGVPPSFPHAANLTRDATGLASWTESDFMTAMRTGKRPDGRALNPFMPWKAMGQMTDVELRALWAYLSSLPPTPAGNR